MNKLKVCLAISLNFILIIILILPARAQQPGRKRPRLSHVTYNGLDTVERSGVFMTYPTNFIASTLKIGYEFRLSHNKGLAILGSIGGSGNNNSFYNLNNFNEVSFEAQLKIYILKDRPALNGLYLAPYTFYKTMNYSTTGYDPYGTQINKDYSVSDFSIGYIIGYQYIFASSFTFNAFMGGGENLVHGNNNPGALNVIFAYPNGINFHAGIGIGIAF